MADKVSFDKLGLSDVTLAALDKAGGMFAFSMKFLLEGNGEEQTVYDMDQEVNALQVDIRKKVLEHLTINPEQDVTASLALITIIVDIERIGDFAKNIVELRGMVADELSDERYIREVDSIREKIESSFPPIIEAFSDADSEKAKELIDEYTWVSTKCDTVLELLVGDTTLGVREAVVYGLLFRYLKRVAAHLRNIATSVVNPFHRLGYKPD
jgi:phosphate uptake regulator